MTLLACLALRLPLAVARGAWFFCIQPLQTEPAAMPNEHGLLEVKYPDESFRRDTYFIDPEAYNPDVHDLADGERPPDQAAAEPSEALKDVVGTRQANAFAERGITELEDAQALSRDEVVAMDGLGDGTADALGLE